MDDLIVQRPQGLYCPAGDFYIDPMRRVHRAVLTHGHADHARAGHGHVLSAADGVGVLRARLGAGLAVQGLAYGQTIDHQGVRISLHPAGHILGSAQVRIERGGQVWVVSGDYHVSGHSGDHNPTCAAFEPVPCHCFITECTFGLPVYRWAPQVQVLEAINRWWQGNADQGRASLLLGYSLGKAQRLLAGLDTGIGPIHVHPAVAAMNAAYRAAGVALPETFVLDGPLPETHRGRALVLAPPTARTAEWQQGLDAAAPAFASGWMQLRRGRRQRGGHRGFVLSDHADWPGLLQAIAATGATRVVALHGASDLLVRWLQAQGLDASGALAQAVVDGAGTS